MFDRLGAAHRVSVGYRGTRDLIFEIGKSSWRRCTNPTPDTWRLEGGEGHAQAALTAH